MIRRPLVLAASFALAALVSSCAVREAQDSLGPSVYDAPPAAQTMPAAKLGLPPQYRAFYDELADYGDWTLIEPYGWCFRPAVNFVAWRPYSQGWWEPSDSYGWIWNSNEPFGWITYHYGSWFYDRFQGWVWQPGPVWGPAWVAWAQIDEEVTRSITEVLAEFGFPLSMGGLERDLAELEERYTSARAGFFVADVTVGIAVVVDHGVVDAVRTISVRLASSLSCSSCADF